MGQSTDGQLCYGLCLDDDVELPWVDEDGNDELEQWWLNVNQFRPAHEIYDENGDYLNGQEATDQQIETYWDERKQWLDAHPLPFELVNYCSGEWPMYILAVPGTLVTASRGCPEIVSAETIVAHDISPIVELCAKYSAHESRIGWFLSSFWG